MSAVDWSDVGNLEFCTGSGWEDRGNTIVGAFLREDGILVVVRRPSGLHVHFVVNDDGRIHDGRKIIRNKPKKITLQECWVIYESDGQHYRTVFSEETAEWLAGNGYIVRHIPVEEREIECGTQS